MNKINTLKIKDKTVTVGVIYGINGMIDCRKVIEHWTKAFEEKLGMKLKGDINPGDNSCGIEWETPSKEAAEELAEFLKSRFGDFDKYLTPREIFPLPGNIIQVTLPPRAKDEIHSGHAKVNPEGIEVGTYGKNREKNVFVEINEEEIQDYMEGNVIFSQNDKNDSDKTTVTALLIPKSRTEDILLDLKRSEVLELGKKLFPMGHAAKVSKDPLPSHITPEQIEGPDTPLDKKESDPKISEPARTHLAPNESLKTDVTAGTVIKYFNAVLGHKRLPKDEWKTVAAAMKPHLDPAGGLNKAAWTQFKGDKTVAKLCREHKEKEKGIEMQ